MPEFFIWFRPSSVKIIEALSEQDAAEKFLELRATATPHPGFPPDCFVQPTNGCAAPRLDETPARFWAVADITQRGARGEVDEYEPGRLAMEADDQNVSGALALKILDALNLSEIEQAKFRFLERGFSKRLANRLIEAGIRYPEELLTKTDSELRREHGIWEGSVSEIHSYQKRFGF